MKKHLLIFIYNISIVFTNFAMEDTSLKWDANRYVTDSSIQSRNAQFLIDWVDKEYGFGIADKIIDIGSGPGNITAEFSRLASCGRVLGIEPDENMFNKATQSYKNIENLRFVQERAENESWVCVVEGSVNKVAAMSSLHWMSDEKMEKTLVNSWRALKQNGIFMAVMQLDRDLMQRPLNKAMKKLILDSPRWAKRFADVQNEFSSIPGKDLDEKFYAFIKSQCNSKNQYSLRPMLIDVGFQSKSIQFKEQKNEFKFDNKEKFVNWILAWIKSFHKIAKSFADNEEDELKKFVEDCVDEYIKILNLSIKLDEPIIYEYQNLFVIAQK